MAEKFIVLTTPRCKWCDKAKALLTLHDKEFVTFNVESAMSDMGILFTASGLKTVPQVFSAEDGRVLHIGGFEALKDYLGAR